jgi:hypothetical protein
LTFRSTVAYATPDSRRLCTAQPVTYFVAS